MSQQGTNGQKDSRNVVVGLTFVELMFAVAVGDTAVQIAKVVKAIAVSGLPVCDALWNTSPSLAHLTLALLVIATSWVGWSHSEATKQYMARLDGVFSLAFLMLLIDVFLVVCYFILSEAAELPADLPGAPLKVRPSIQQDILWIAVIMATYFAWNLCFITIDWWQGRNSFCNKRWVSAISAAIAFGVVLVFWFCQPKIPTRGAVLWFDGALLTIVFMFRVRVTRPLKAEEKEEKPQPKPKEALSGWAALTILVLSMCAIGMMWAALRFAGPT